MPRRSMTRPGGRFSRHRPVALRDPGCPVPSAKFQLRHGVKI
jgi:hypothetical protein